MALPIPIPAASPEEICFASDPRAGLDSIVLVVEAAFPEALGVGDIVLEETDDEAEEALELDEVVDGSGLGVAELGVAF